MQVFIVESTGDVFPTLEAARQSLKSVGLDVWGEPYLHGINGKLMLPVGDTSGFGSPYCDKLYLEERA